jgi:hypothetical protein
LGVLTDIVIADPRESAFVSANPARITKWRGIDANGIDLIKLATLWALLSNDPSKANARDRFEMLHEIPDEGPWVFRLSEVLVELLAAVDDARAPPSIGSAWAKTEKFTLDGWDATAVGSILSELRKLAPDAMTARKSMLMWMSL